MTRPASPPDREAAPDPPVADPSGEPSSDHAGHPSGSLRPLLLVAVLCYVPLLLTRPGWISADTKSYLYLDPARLLSRAWSMWDPSVGLGTVSHQTIGYLWPMGPWFWFFETIGVPDWVAQRLWWGTLLFAAASGVVVLLRRFGWPALAIWPAAVAYALTPYSVAYLGRLSGVLMPMVGLPWLLAFTVAAIRRRSWRDPALFGLVAATVGSVNLTALALVGLGPLAWVAYVLLARVEPPRAVLAAVGRIGLLTTLTSAWWLAGLSVQATHGIDIVRYSESAEVVARTSTAFEVLRGLGYWFFYGGDKLELWIEPSFSYTQRPLLIAASFAVPVLALVGAAVGRWRHRAFFAAIYVLGAILAVGAHRWDDPSVLGRAIKVFLGTDRGLAFRSLPRAVPLVALAAAVLAGAGLVALARRHRAAGRTAAGVLVVASIVAMVPLWQRSLVQDSLARQEVPAYWLEAAELIDARDDGTRVLEIPGSDFASYRWGNTVDPITPGLVDRPYVARELVPYGTPHSADLLNALDLRLQERTLEPQALTPAARLLRAGDLVVRGDLQYERYAVARPRLVWELVQAAPGLGEPIALTDPTPNEPTSRLQLQDETWQLRERGLPHSPAVAVVPVEGVPTIVDTKPASGAVVLSGDGSGIVDAATAELIDGTELLLYSASLTPEEISTELERGASFVVTDTNRQRGERWGSLRHTRAHTERADETWLAENLTDNRLPRFPDAPESARTVTLQEGGIRADATAYGNPITFAGEERAAMAVDGDPTTAWATAAFSDARGERIVLTLDRPEPLDHVWLHQLPEDRTSRALTRVRIELDDGTVVDVDLGPESRTAPGQRIDLGEHDVARVEITVLADNLGDPPRYLDAGPVGFSEITLGDDPPVIDELVRMPTDLVDALDGSTTPSGLTYLMTRIRQDPTDRTREDEERAIVRRFRVPADGEFTLSGSARVSARADGPILDDLVGPSSPEVTVSASTRISGSRVQRASAALDGDPTTAWTTPFGNVVDETITVTTAEPRVFDGLDLLVVADGDHSVPTRLEVRVDGEVVAEPELPAIPDGTERLHTVAVPVDLPPTAGTQLDVEITATRPVTSIDWTSTNPIEHPAAIAELGIDGLVLPSASPDFDTTCRDDLLWIDDVAVPVRISADRPAALDGAPLPVEPCDAGPIELSAGDHELRTAEGVRTGIDLDQLVLRSGVEESRPTRAVEPTVAADAGPDEVTVGLTGLEPGEPVWLILGQSHTDGWTASAGGDDLGAPQLVDGFANGWLLVPTSTSMEVDLAFAPQRRVDIGLAVSALAAVGCLLLVARRPGRPSRRDPLVVEDPLGGAPAGPLVAVLAGVAVALGSLVVIGAPIAVALGVATSLAARHRGVRAGLAVLPAVLLATAALFVVAWQVRYSIAPGVEWVAELEKGHPIALAAVLALAADTVVDRLWRRSSEGGGHHRTAEAGG